MRERLPRRFQRGEDRVEPGSRYDEVSALLCSIRSTLGSYARRPSATPCGQHLARFFVHIATISVGLLIALGLEQAVEAVHHRHQRHVLEAQLEQEADRNLPLVEKDIDALRPQLAWVRSAVIALNGARPDGQGRVSLAVLPARGRMFDGLGYAAPSRAAWAVATADGVAAMLPESEGQVYARVDFEAEQLQEQLKQLGMSLDEMANLSNQREGLTGDRALYLSAGERDLWVHVLSTTSVRLVAMIKKEQIEAGAIRGVQHHAQSIQELFGYF